MSRRVKGFLPSKWFPPITPDIDLGDEDPGEGVERRPPAQSGEERLGIADVDRNRSAAYTGAHTIPSVWKRICAAGLTLSRPSSLGVCE